MDRDKTKIDKIVIVASIDRPLHDTLDLYHSSPDYLEQTLRKLSKENKETHLCGEFNRDD